MNLREKLEKLYDRSDADKWAHPEIAERFGFMTGIPTSLEDSIFNQDAPREERAAAAAASNAKVRAMFEGIVVPGMETTTIPGLNEDDPDIELVIYHPSKESRRPRPVVFGVAGGGMYAVMVEGNNFGPLADRFNALVVAPRYRDVFSGGQYPGAINDCHAAYKWVVDNAEELNINPDKIVLTGASSGSNMALALAFRLKRFGYKPRGVVTESSFADNRPIYATRTITNGNNWNANCQYLSSLEYLGANNLATANDPEMYPNYATAEDCIGLCPIFMHTDAEEASSGSCRAFVDQLSQAGVYNELHIWGGSCHAAIANTFAMGAESAYAQRYGSIFLGNIGDCLKYDLRRQWILDELGE